MLTSLPLLWADLVAICVSWLAATTTFWLADTLPMLDVALPAMNVALLGSLLIAIPAAFQLQGLYPAVCVSPIEETKRVLVGIAICSIGFIFWGMLTDMAGTTVLVLVLMACSALTIPTFRMIVRSCVCGCKWWRQSTIVIGKDWEIAMISRWFDECPELGLRPYDEGGEKPTQVMVTKAGQNKYRLTQDALALSFPRVIFLSDAPLAEESWPEPTTNPEKISILSGNRFNSRLLFPQYQMFKRSLDIGLILLASPVLIPLMVCIYVAIRATSRGPGLFSQPRPGRHGKNFNAWKFRSMEVDADKRLQEYLDANPELRDEWETNRKLKHDPRITLLGSFLRRTSLDELPQLWNVLIGEMSLVGPRPILLSQVSEYEGYELYTSVSPGITGLWQTSGRSNTTFRERLAYDAYYVRNWSPWFDIYLLIRTVRTVFLQEGAY